MGNVIPGSENDDGAEPRPSIYNLRKQNKAHRGCNWQTQEIERLRTELREKWVEQNRQDETIQQRNFQMEGEMISQAG